MFKSTSKYINSYIRLTSRDASYVCQIHLHFIFPFFFAFFIFFPVVFFCLVVYTRLVGEGLVTTTMTLVFYKST